MTTVYVRLKDGGPAFPRPHSWDESPNSGMHEGNRPEPHGAQHGMSLRDYFAARVLSNVDVIGNDLEKAARTAYAVADAMLKERAK